jgi:hypothetical protein
VGRWVRPPHPAAGLEALMASKNKAGRNTKTAATRDLKQKRQDKKAKKSSDKRTGLI